jgi:hypothetical protein
MVPCAGATDIPGGPVSGTWPVAGSPYYVLGSITVPAGTGLTIEPGVEVVISGLVEWTVEGVLLAEGTPTDSIRIRGVDPWEGIRLENETETSRFAYCHISDAEDALRSIDSPLVLEHCLLDDHTVGIHVYGIGNPDPPAVLISHATIRDCQQHGIFIVENSNTVIQECEITRCALDGSPRGAIQLSNQSAGGSNDPVIEGNWIHHNVWQGITAFDITGQARIAPLVTYNQIEYNLTGVYLLYASGILSRNEINHNYQEGNPNSGAGVMIAGAAAHPVLTHNTLTGNFTGLYITDGATANLGDLNNSFPGDDGHNHIYDNVDLNNNTWSVYSTSSADIMAENNLWDSDDYGVIAQTIYDGNDNPAYGFVDFDPILDSAAYPDDGQYPAAGPVLSHSSPNPFTLRTTVRFQLSEMSVGQAVRFDVYDPTGRRVRSLPLGTPRAGGCTVIWDGTNEQGQALPAGVYSGQLRLGGKRLSARLVLVR